MKLENTIKSNYKYILIILGYLIIGLILVQYYQYCLITPDGVSYISIAQKYANLDISNALNGYWSPLFSWFIVPVFLFTNNPFNILFMTKIISLIIGVFLLIGLERLSQKLGLNEKYCIIVMISSIPMIYLISFIFTTPDLLVTCLLVFYLGIIFDPKYSNKIINGVLCGIIGSLAYLSKSFAFVFFLIHYILFNSIFYFRSISKRKKISIVKNLIFGITIFFVISGVWTSLISERYGYLTISTSSQYNFNLIGPESQGHPVHYYGLIQPSNRAISAWDDPSYLVTKEWKPFKDWNSFMYYLKVINLNLSKIFYLYSSMLFCSVIIIFLSILILIKSSTTKIDYKMNIIYLFLTITLFSGGFSLIIVEERYLLLGYFLIIILGIYILSILYKFFLKEKFRLKNFKNIFLILFVCSIIFSPIIGLYSSVNSREDVYCLSQTLKEDYNIHGNLASSGEWVGWELTLFLSYYLGTKYYGQIMENRTNSEINDELNKYNIDYYIVWGSSGNNLKLYDYNEIKKDESLKLSTFGKRINIKIFAKNK